jgi:Ser/Thr protein kinase RdoA (MazF antagonist)
MSKELATRILQQYGLQPREVHPAQKGYRNKSFAATLPDGSVVNTIIYKKEPGIVQKIRHANRVADFAAALGLPTRKTYDERIIKLGYENPAFAALYSYLPGTTIPWEAYTMRHIKLLGGMLSDLHFALKSLPYIDEPYIIDDCRALLKQMEKYFTDDGVHDAMATKLGLAIFETTRLRPALTTCIDMPMQALHMDFVRGNILFDGKGNNLHISGILDFEKTAWGPPIFDIARTLAFLIVDCKYKEESKIRKYFLHSGYNKRGKSKYAPNLLLEDIIDFFLLYDFYKFLRHNPYESLQDNEHFVRTRDFLLARRILIKTLPLY